MKKIFLLTLLMWISFPASAQTYVSNDGGRIYVSNDGRGPVYVIEEGGQTYVAHDERTHDAQMCHIAYERRDTIHAILLSKDYSNYGISPLELKEAWKKLPQLCESVATLDLVQFGNLGWALLIVEKALQMKATVKVGPQ